MPLPFEHAARRLLPTSVQRRRLGEQALRCEFLAAMSAELDQLTDALLGVERARDRANAGTADAARHTAALDHLAHDIDHIVTDILTDPGDAP
ncbi:MAG: hypothetical protein AB7L13_24855 [Acidimicrobiia bacterium]